MEREIKSIPLTLVDFLAVLVPGFVWLILIISTFRLFAAGPLAANPVAALGSLSTFLNDLHNPFVAGLSVVIVALLIGYIARPYAMRIAERLARFEFKFHRDTRAISWAQLTFPFTAIHEKQPYCIEAKKVLTSELLCPLESLAGHQPFSGAKRYLRVAAPALYEESEHMEAETRLTGAILIATTYSLFLSIIAAAIYSRGAIGDSLGGIASWLTASVIAGVVLALDFNYLRNREIRYTYTNVLISAGRRDRASGSA